MLGSLVDPWVIALRARRLLARPWARRALVVLVAGATGLAVTASVQAAEGVRERWGATRPVVVARRDLAIGETVDSSAVDVRDLPAVAVTDAALDEVPLGAVVRQPVAAGEPVIGDRLAPQGLTGVAALVPTGSRAVAIPVGPAGIPPVEVGDQVDVLAMTAAPADEHGHENEDVTSAAAGSPAVALVERAPVVDVGEAAVSVAVPAIDVPALLAGLTQGAVLLTLAGA
ncbi:MAG: SAF domain-containing protein [Acidimicrobiales bacterium]